MLVVLLSNSSTIYGIFHQKIANNKAYFLTIRYS